MSLIPLTTYETRLEFFNQLATVKQTEKFKSIIPSAPNILWLGFLFIREKIFNTKPPRVSIALNSKFSSDWGKSLELISVKL